MVVVVKSPEKIDAKVKELVPKPRSKYVIENKGKLNDSVTIASMQACWILSTAPAIFSPSGAVKKNGTALADSMYAFIAASRLYGLFPFRLPCFLADQYPYGYGIGFPAHEKCCLLGPGRYYVHRRVFKYGQGSLAWAG